MKKRTAVSMTQDNLLAFVAILLQHIDVTKLSDFERLLLERIKSGSATLRKHFERSRELRAAFEEYGRIQEQSRAELRRLNREIAMLGLDKVLEHRKDIDPSILKKADQWGGKIALWEAIQTILEQESELQIVDLHERLREFGFKSSRQAVESAIAYHDELFDTETRGREKFVFLKGVQ